VAAKTGNTNALKHGLYAKRFKADEVRALKQMPNDDLRQEIALLRVVIDRILLLAEGEQDTEGAVKLMNSLTTAVTTLNTTIRTHSLLTGNYTPLDDALAGALDDVPFYVQTTEQAAE
jgi:hypothetical protein